MDDNPVRESFIDGYCCAVKAHHWTEHMTGAQVDALIAKARADALLHLEYREWPDEQHKAKVGGTVLKLYPERP